MFALKSFASELAERPNTALLAGILRGVEREALRVDQQGRLSTRPHPAGLGSALTHPYITTDFSEALLEFITPPTHRVDDLLAQLDLIHRAAVSEMGDELLWTHSMPCETPVDADIPVARYGNSHIGRMKTAYRNGLGHRYGRTMQTVAGVHYNFSLPDAFWAYLYNKESTLLSFESFKNRSYFSLIRNFRRHYWLLILLFGASPLMSPSFAAGRPHNLQLYPGERALYRPLATSLRMGDMGYQSHAQENLKVCYNKRRTYIKTLNHAILSPHEAYKELPLVDGEGVYQQLSYGLLQIENEFYSPIRPKRSAKHGETALTALHNRGVEYLEVRCLDVNPDSELGISADQIAVIDAFLLYCALSESPSSDSDEFDLILRNQRKVVNRGRDPALVLEHPHIGEIKAKEWASTLLEVLRLPAALLDNACECNRHLRAIEDQQRAIEDYSQLPSARILSEFEQSGGGYSEYVLAKAKAHKASLQSRPLSTEQQQRYKNIAIESVAEQAEIEAASTGEFRDFLHRYYEQYQALNE